MGNAKGQKPEKGKYAGFHSAKFWVSNAKQIADWYCLRFGFKKIAFKGLKSGSRDTAAIAIKQGKGIDGKGPVIYVFEAPLNPVNPSAKAPIFDFLSVKRRCCERHTLQG